MTEPFTHHEIMAMIEPFTRSGRQLDLAASDRLERRLLFKPVERCALREVLELANPQPDSYRLIRRVTTERGLEARLRIEGRNPGDLLAAIDSVPSSRHFREGHGFEIAASHRLEPGGGALERLLFTDGVARIDELTLSLQAPRMSGINAELELADRGGDDLKIPDDLLAVLGRDWSCLRPGTSGWRGTLRLRGREPKRSRDAESKLAAAAMHIAQTWSEPPRRFHERRVSARWAVAFRRMIPILASIALIVGAAALPRLHLPETSAIRMLLFNAPPLLMMLVFCLRELPRFEIPPWPRPSNAPHWRDPPLAGDAVNAR